MTEESYSGEELEEALESEELTARSLSMSGFVKSSDKEGTISFSVSNGREWIEIPTQMINEAERVPRVSRINDDYPTVTITFNEPEDDQTTAIYELFTSFIDTLSRTQESRVRAPSGRPSTAAERPTGGAGSQGGWQCCKRGKAYPCGTLLGGGTMICCDEWEPCSVIKNPAFVPLEQEAIGF